MLPIEWEKRFIDLNVSQLAGTDLEWADIVLIGAMLAQQVSALHVIEEAHRMGKRILAGGPLFCHELIDQGLFNKVNHIVVGEAEGLIPQFLEDLAAGCARPVYRQDGYPEIQDVPTPMWSLVDLRKYAMVNLQFVRGCPYDCEFCYGHVLNGHVQRAKSKQQIDAELDALFASGWRSSIFVCDDNLVGNRKLARTLLLPTLMEWMEAHDFPFTFTGAASVNLAKYPEIMDMLVSAGFESVTLGLESPHEESLAEVHKRQNLNLDLLDVVHTIQSHGIEVQTGMILGFDHDPPEIFQMQVDFIQRSGISNALMSLLFALPNTALYDRLKKENRLTDYEIGKCIHGAINFQPSMPYATLIAGYKYVLQSLYSPDRFYERMETFLNHYHAVPRRFHLRLAQLIIVIRAMYFLGIKEKWRERFWVLLLRAGKKGWDAPVAYLRQAIMGYFVRKDIAEYAPAPDIGF